ncbi:hypothetical protein [Pyruvatibacter sp.]|uniref:hypothetical protein n=1 Tax=Pyruvatibacter sp. TaxID=1981328 RepID=UPI0029678979|nr:hypothetical protein [Alphaproteobacteria bacterium]
MTGINEDLFYTLAQITIALAGFSAVAIGLVAQNKSDWQLFEKANAWSIFGFAVLTFLMSIVPPIFINAGYALDTALTAGLIVPAIGALPIAYYAVTYSASFFASNVEQTRSTQTLVGKLIAYGAGCWAVAGMLLVWLTLFDVLIPRTETVYVGLTLIGIVLSLLHFALFLGLSIEDASEG